MKRFLTAILVAALLLLGGCTLPEGEDSYAPPERPHLYWQDIDVVVTNVTYRRWFAGTHWHEVTVCVESPEYGIKGSSYFRGSGFFGVPEQWNYKVGDIVEAEMYTWVMDSTGEVIDRTINRVY